MNENLKKILIKTLYSSLIFLFLLKLLKLRLVVHQWIYYHFNIVRLWLKFNKHMVHSFYKLKHMETFTINSHVIVGESRDSNFSQWNGILRDPTPFGTGLGHIFVP